MKHRVRLCRAMAACAALLAAGLVSLPLAAQESPPALIDSGTIIRNLKPSPHVATRGLTIEAKTSADTEAGGGGGTINLDIRFGNDSDRLTEATQAQLSALGSALNSPELARAKFLIAGHTSATGSAEHNQKLSQARARSVRTYLIGHFHIAPERIEATGYGSSRPLPDFPAGALQQRRVEIITLASN